MGAHVSHAPSSGKLSVASTARNANSVICAMPTSVSEETRRREWQCMPCRLAAGPTVRLPCAIRAEARSCKVWCKNGSFFLHDPISQGFVFRFLLACLIRVAPCLQSSIEVVGLPCHFLSMDGS